LADKEGQWKQFQIGECAGEKGARRGWMGKRLNMLLTLVCTESMALRGEESDLSDMQICRPLELHLSTFFLQELGRLQIWLAGALVRGGETAANEVAKGGSLKLGPPSLKR
jgi:hypothetical protein